MKTQNKGCFTFFFETDGELKKAKWRKGDHSSPLIFIILFAFSFLN